MGEGGEMAKYLYKINNTIFIVIWYLKKAPVLIDRNTFGCFFYFYAQESSLRLFYCHHNFSARTTTTSITQLVNTVKKETCIQKNRSCVNKEVCSFIHSRSHTCYDTRTIIFSLHYVYANQTIYL